MNLLHRTLRLLGPCLTSHRCAWIVLVLVCTSSQMRSLAAGIEPPEAVSAFLEARCLDCHTGADAEAGLDLTGSLSHGLNPNDTDHDHVWTRIIDRVAAGEMPPAEAELPNAAEREKAVRVAGGWLSSTQQKRDARLGRVRGRRLTRLQVERSLHELLGIDIPLANHLPEEGRPRGFTTVAEFQSISRHYLARHLAVVDEALDEAFRRVFETEKVLQRDLSVAEVARKNPRRRCREPEMREGEAVVWSCTMPYYGRIPATTAPVDGWYQFRLTAHGIKLPEGGGVWTAIHRGPCVSTAPLLEPVRSFEAGAEPAVIAFDTWLPRGHMLEIRPQDATVKRARFEGGQVGVGEGEPQEVPGIAINRLEMRRVFRRPASETRAKLFGDLRIEQTKVAGLSKPVSGEPLKAIEELIPAFAERAFRRPVAPEEVAAYVELAKTAHAESKSLAVALRMGYRAILCAPGFLYFNEQPALLDDYALASRLSYFLTGGPPDQALLASARSGTLHKPAVLRQQVGRMLARGAAADDGPTEAERQFTKDFTAEWLDLDQIDFTVPDRRRYWFFDPIVQMAMLDEAHAFIGGLLHEDGPVVNLVAADHSFLNSRLARFYGVEGVVGGQVRRVALPSSSHRGGVLTLGAVLKVTANGTTTSPVVRGAWFAERLLGLTIPPPPAGVPAIEPDIRGATTIREQLAKHQADASCASCHRQMDPYGFALESFDPAGQWRTSYRSFAKGKTQASQPINASGKLPDGRAFSGIDELKHELALQPADIARGMVGHLLVYGTGGELSFRDRRAVEEIVVAAKASGYGLKTLLTEVVASEVFRSK